MSRWWVLLLVACKSKEVPPAPPRPPSPERVTHSTAPPPKPSVHLVACAPAKIAPRVRPAPGAPSSGRAAHVADVKVWTPYAAGEGMAPDDIAKVAAHDLEGVIAGKLDKLDACFGDREGQMRAMLTVAFDGGVIGARVGGLGDHDSEACVAGALVGLKVSAPPIISEVSCDLVRGRSDLWRLTLDGRYEVIELTKDTPPVADVADASSHVYAIVTAPDVPGSALARALHAVRSSQATLVAVRMDAGAPQFIGMGHDARTESFGDGEPIAFDRHGAPHACADHQPIATSRSPLAALDDHCASAPCGTLALAFDATTGANQIALDAFLANEHGFRVLVGGDGCAQPPSTGSASISGGSGGSAAGGSAPSSASPSSR